MGGFLHGVEDDPKRDIVLTVQAQSSALDLLAYVSNTY